MLRREFLRRMAFAAVASGMLGIELAARAPAPQAAVRNTVLVEWDPDPRTGYAGRVISVSDQGRVLSHDQDVVFVDASERTVYVDASEDPAVNTYEQARRLAEAILEDLR